MTEPNVSNSTGNEKPSHPTTDWMKRQIQFFKTLTAKKEEDNIWLTGIKYFFQGIMVLVLIALSPFALIAIIISVLVTG